MKMGSFWGLLPIPFLCLFPFYLCYIYSSVLAVSHNYIIHRQSSIKCVEPEHMQNDYMSLNVCLVRTERSSGGQHLRCAGSRRGFDSQESIPRFSPWVPGLCACVLGVCACVVVCVLSITCFEIIRTVSSALNSINVVAQKSYMTPSAPGCFFFKKYI